jgi:rSAM/selenodomain-associated transferase 1
MSIEKCVLMFVKSPDAGLVKTRLSCDIDEKAVLSLYRNFGLDLLETLRRGKYAFKIIFTPSEAEEKISGWLGKDVSYEPQRGNDLGERMKNAFSNAFLEGFTRVLLIGSDSPDLPDIILHDAFGLDSHDAVIGPAFDGGYYLIGFKNSTFLPEIFAEISWSTDTVFARTMEIFKKNRYRVSLLPKWRDVDSIEDLRALAERNRHTDFAGSKTMDFIAKNRSSLFRQNKKGV